MCVCVRVQTLFANVLINVECCNFAHRRVYVCAKRKQKMKVLPLFWAEILIFLGYTFFVMNIVVIQRINAHFSNDENNYRGAMVKNVCSRMKSCKSSFSDF